MHSVLISILISPIAIAQHGTDYKITRVISVGSRECSALSDPYCQ